MYSISNVASRALEEAQLGTMLGGAFWRFFHGQAPVKILNYRVFTSRNVRTGKFGGGVSHFCCVPALGGATDPDLTAGGGFPRGQNRRHYDACTVKNEPQLDKLPTRHSQYMLDPICVILVAVYRHRRLKC